MAILTLLVICVAIVYIVNCRRSTVGGRAFPVADAKLWNVLPSDVTSAHRWRCYRTCSRRICSATATKLFDSEWHFPPVIIRPPSTVVLATVLTV